MTNRCSVVFFNLPPCFLELLRTLDSVDLGSKIMNELFIHYKDAFMPRTKEANEHLRETQRLKILQAARKVLAHKGMTATMADIAITAGVSQGLAYRYFASKDEIVKVLISQIAQSTPPTLQQIHEISDSPSKRLKVLISRIFESGGERLEYYQFAMNALNHSETPDDLRKTVRKYGQTIENAIRQLIVEGQANGDVASGDPDQMVMVVMACLNGLSSFALRYPERFKKHYPDVEIILRMLKP